MLLHDAWPSLRFEGKPQCHSIPIAKESGELAVSVGCMLSRVRTAMSITRSRVRSQRDRKGRANSKSPAGRGPVPIP